MQERLKIMLTDGLRHFAQSRPLLVARLPMVCLLLALLLALLNTLSPLAVWSLWWPVALVVLALALEFIRMRPHGIGFLYGTALLALMAYLFNRGWQLSRGPVPGEAIDDTLRLIGTAVCGAGVAWMARVHLRSVSIMLFSAIAFALLLPLVLPTYPAPWLTLTLAGIITVLALGVIWSWRGCGWTRRLQGSRPLAVAGLLIAFVSGLLLGLRASAGIELNWQATLEQLWLRSVLMGWGSTPLERLAEVLHPMLNGYDHAAWGLTGVLARGGVLGLALCALAILSLLGSASSSVMAGSPEATTRWLWRCATLLLLGSWVTGGWSYPPFIALLIFFAMAALAPPRPRARKRVVLWVQRGMCYALWGAMVVVGMALFVPVQGLALKAKATGPNRNVSEAREYLQRAMRRLPDDPGIYVALASVLRTEMTERRGWSEQLFQDVVSLYDQARALDPYDPLIASQQVRFLLICERHDEALALVRESLRNCPNSAYWQQWLLNYANQEGDTALAQEMIHDGLRQNPHAVGWWERRWAMARELGQGPIAGQALAALLSAEPANPAFQGASQQRFHRASQDRPPAIETGGDE